MDRALGLARSSSARSRSSSIGLLFAEPRGHAPHAEGDRRARWRVVGVALLVADRLGRRHARSAERPRVGRGAGAGRRAVGWRSIPGVSRSGATITTGLVFGLDRDAAARFSFLLGVPAMFAAAAHEGRQLLEQPMDAAARPSCSSSASSCRPSSGYATVKYFLRYLAGHSLAVFAWYRHRARGGHGRLAARVRPGLNAVVMQLAAARGSSPASSSPCRSSPASRRSSGSSASSTASRRRIYARLLGPRGARPGAADDGGRRARSSGVVATNVIGRRLLQRVEHWLLLVPVFKTVYAPGQAARAGVLAATTSTGFKQVVLVEDARARLRHGVSDARVHARPRRRARSRWWRSTSRPITCTSATSSVFPRERVLFPRSDRGRGRPHLPDRRDGRATARGHRRDARR